MVPSWIAPAASALAIGLSMLGHRVEGSDSSEASICRATREAAARGLAAEFRVVDNAIPHLQSGADVQRALTSMRARLRQGGTLLISLRDYAPLLAERPASTPIRSIAMASFDASSTKFGIGRTNGATLCIFSSQSNWSMDSRRVTSSDTTARLLPVKLHNCSSESASRTFVFTRPKSQATTNRSFAPSRRRPLAAAAQRRPHRHHSKVRF
jgi:hypothetical protein